MPGCALQTRLPAIGLLFCTTLYFGCAGLDRLTTRNADEKPLLAKDEISVDQIFQRSVWELTDDSLRLDYIAKFCLVQRLAPSRITELKRLSVTENITQVAELIHEALLPYDPIKTTPENEYLTVTLPERIDYLIGRAGIHPGQESSNYWMDDLGKDVLRLGIPYEDSLICGWFADYLYVTYPNHHEYGYCRVSSDWRHSISSEQYRRARTMLSGTKGGNNLALLQKLARAEALREFAIDSRVVDTGFEYDSLKNKHVLLDLVPLPWPGGACPDGKGLSFIASANVRLQVKPFINRKDTSCYFDYKYVIYDLADQKRILAADSQRVFIPGFDSGEPYLAQVRTPGIHCMRDSSFQYLPPKTDYVLGLMISNYRGDIWQTSETFSLEDQRPVTVGVKGAVLENGIPNVTNAVYRGDTAEILVPIIGLPYYEPQDAHHGFCSFYFIHSRDYEQGMVNITDFGIFDESQPPPILEDSGMPKIVPDAYIAFAAQSRHSHQVFRVPVPEDLDAGEYHVFVVVQSSADYRHPISEDRVPIVRGYLKVDLRK